MTNFEYLKTLSIEDFVESGIVSALCDMCVYGQVRCNMRLETCFKGIKAWLALEKDQDEKKSPSRMRGRQKKHGGSSNYRLYSNT